MATYKSIEQTESTVIIISLIVKVVALA